MASSNTREPRSGQGLQVRIDAGALRCTKSQFTEESVNGAWERKDFNPWAKAAWSTPVAAGNG